ncbi:PspA/IM30 family protein [Ectobacillus panaciterrae]|uniref:PspA/IM30 family protein n=1 Tax=Ectobacillus panaciterrae TaxID=363872 RepID=UPI0004170EBD|nr:PspA/IM30 family protein [Ectobacillus panaciterrae]
MKKSLFQRVRDVVLADIHNALDEQEKKNPIALLNQYLRDGEREAQKIEKLIERHKMLKTNFFRELEQARYMAKKRKHQAEVAGQAGEAALEARAVQEAEYYEGQANRLEGMYTKTIEQTEELQHRLSEMKNKLKEMHAKRMELMARENVAHVNRRINDTMHKISEGNPFLRFEEIEEHMRDIEQRINEGYERDTFDLKIAKLEKQLKEKESVHQ